MPPIPIEQVVIGIYIGLITGIFPAFVAFAFGFSFKYFTDVTVPGLGVVMMTGAIAGISGGLMGILDPQVVESWAGITAIVVILMACLWAHGMGDRLGDKTPRKLTLERFRESKLTADLVERVDSYGQLRVRPVGDIAPIEGYPPLPQELRNTLKSHSWKFSADLSLPELEDRLEQTLLDNFDLIEVSVSIDRRGQARIAAAPMSAGLSRRVPDGTQAVSIETLLPTGMARGDEVSIALPGESVRGPVLSAHTNGVEQADEPVVETPDDDPDLPPETRRAPTTTGGDGRVTVALPPDEAKAVLKETFAPVSVHSRGKQREYEAIAVLKRQGNRFRKIVLAEGSDLVAKTIGSARIRQRFGVDILSVRRGTEQFVGPRGQTTLAAGDELIVVGKQADLRRFAQAVR